MVDQPILDTADTLMPIAVTLGVSQSDVGDTLVGIGGKCDASRSKLETPAPRLVPSLDTLSIADLRNLGRDDLHDLWRRLHRKPPPKSLTGDLLLRALAHRIQVGRHGGLSRRMQQRLASAARQTMKVRASTGEESRKSAGNASHTLRPGTRLIREWQGEAHEVIVLADGFLWRGETCRSLSMIAKAITGTVWNGWIFFGVERKSGRRLLKQRSNAVEVLPPIERQADE